jgi:DNA-binding NtrC family response regulator
VCQRATLLCAANIIEPEHFSLPPTGDAAPAVADAPPESRDPSLAACDERQQVIDALAQCAGNQSRAAKLLGISRKTLVARLDTFGLPRPRKPTDPS